MSNFLPTKFYAIRLKDDPSLFVPKQNTTYAIRNDVELEHDFTRPDGYGADRYGWKKKSEVISKGLGNGWLVPAQKAKIYTTAKGVSRIFALCDCMKAGADGKAVSWYASGKSTEGKLKKDYPKGTFNEYEVVISDKGQETVVPATEFYHNWKAYQ